MTKAPYIVYTPDKDFVLEKDDISGGGSGGGVLIIESEVIVADNEIKLKKTWKEIKDAFTSGESCIVVDTSSSDTISRFMVISVVDTQSVIGNVYTVGVFATTGVTTFTTDSENGYPSLDIS